MKAVRSIFWLAILTIFGACSAFVYYGFGPILPDVLPRFEYQRGWLDAWRFARQGGRAYSFDRYFVEGLSDFAKIEADIQGIEPPQGLRRKPDYIRGFNRYMEKLLSEELKVDFPAEFVRKYMTHGWLDLTANQPIECPVHKIRMEVMTIPFEVVWPFTMAREEFPREIDADSNFPYPSSSAKVDASILPRPPLAKTRVCLECTLAEIEWLKNNKNLTIRRRQGRQVGLSQLSR